MCRFLEFFSEVIAFVTMLNVIIAFCTCQGRKKSLFKPRTIDLKLVSESQPTKECLLLLYMGRLAVKYPFNFCK